MSRFTSKSDPLLTFYTIHSTAGTNLQITVSQVMKELVNDFHNLIARSIQIRSDCSMDDAPSRRRIPTNRFAKVRKR